MILSLSVVWQQLKALNKLLGITILIYKDLEANRQELNHHNIKFLQEVDSYLTGRLQRKTSFLEMTT